MKYMLAIVMLFFNLFSQTFAQDCSLLNSNLSPQYISYDHIDESLIKDTNERNIWLRLHNNTNCVMILESESQFQPKRIRLVKTSGGNTKIEFIPLEEVSFNTPEDGASIELSYKIQENRMKKSSMFVGFHHYTYTIRLLPKQSILFNVSSEYFIKKYHIIVPFNYEWELNNKGILNSRNSVFHEIYYYNSELPDEVKKKIKETIQ